MISLHRTRQIYRSLIFKQPKRTMPRKFSMWHSQRVGNRLMKHRTARSRDWRRQLSRSHEDWWLRRPDMMSYGNFAYFALACFRMGMSGSASFHSEEIIVSGAGLPGVPLQRVSTSEAQMRQRR
jgi:hypothetical protein